MDVPTRPGWLLPEAKREWSRIVPELVRLGLIATIDRAALSNYCQWWARWVQAEKALKEHGLTFRTIDTGFIRARPEVALAEKAARMVKLFLAEFGLTPASRSRLSVEKPQAGDPFADFLAKTGQM